MSSTQRSVISYPYSTSTLYPYTTGNSPADPYYSNVSLLMPMNGTNGSNTLLDYSYNQKTIDNPAGATISTSKFKFGGSSLFFDGVNDAISITNSYDFDFGANDFTIEMWVNRLGAGTGDRFLISRNNGTDFLFRWQSGGNLQFWINATEISNYTFAFTINQWYHLAVVRNGNTFTLFVDGTNVATGTSAAAITYTSASPVLIGGYTTGDQYNGYMDDLRITKGIARYTSSFTPPTIANPNFGSWYDNNYSNVVLLLHMDGSNNSTVFTDLSSNNKTVTANSVITSTTKVKFGNASAYIGSTSTYLSIPSAGNLTFGSSDFTMECWVNIPSSAAGYAIFAERDANLGAGSFAILASVNQLYVLISTNGANWAVSQSFGSIPTNTWTHVALSRVGSTLYCATNGSVTSVALSGTIFTSNQPFTIGGYPNANGASVGHYIDDVRITFGVGRYTSNFTPSKLAFPDGPSSADPYYSNASLLLPLNGINTSTTFVDSSKTANSIVASGNAQISTTQSKFGGSSAYFDGTGDYLTATINSVTSIAGDFTAECWIYPTDSGSTKTIFSMQESGSPDRMWLLERQSTTKLVLYCGSSSIGFNRIVGTTNISSNSWHHVALSRESGTLKIWLNGVLEGSWSGTGSTISDNSSYNLSWYKTLIGSYYGTSEYFLGYIDDLRITPGIARYTSNFTVPVRPNPTTGIPYDNYYDNVILLLHGDGANSGTSIIDSSSYSRAPSIRNAQTVTSTTQYKYGTASIYLNATTQQLAYATTSLWNLTGSDWTIEMWFYNTGGANSLLNRRDTSVGFTSGWVLTTGGIRANINGVWSDTQMSWTGPAANTWNHIAWTLNGTTMRAFLNGVLVGTLTSVTQINDQGNSIFFGTATNAGENAFQGYIDNFRWTRGIARYTSNFTPPTQAFPDQAPIFDPFYSNVSLLLPLTGTNASTTFVDNSPIPKVVTPTGNTQISTTQWKWGGSSVYFDGNGDYLSIPANSGFKFDTGDFTIECWFYTSSTTQTFGKRILNKYDYITGDYGWLLECFRTVGSLEFILFNSSGTLVVDLVSNTSVSANTWNHVAVSRNKEKIYLFLNGRNVAENLSMIGSDDYSTSLNIGAQTITSPTGTFFDGYINDVRISKGVARYLNNFTPPRRPFPNQ